MSIVGVIGGSGLYELEGLKVTDSIHLSTPFGEPSDNIILGELNNVKLLFLPRHGQGHRIAPHCVNYCANIFALKKLGAQQIISVSAVGSLKETIRPGDIVLVDQYIDRTASRRSTFFEGHELVAHVSCAEPIDRSLQTALFESAQSIGGVRVQKGGVYICINGPQFSTRAESSLYRNWQADVIGMTNLPEAKLAREAELPYASITMVTDYDCWHENEENVNVESVLEILNRNVEIVRKVIIKVLDKLPDPGQSPATSALQHAIVTAPEHVSEHTRELLEVLIGKYLPRRVPCHHC